MQTAEREGVRFPIPKTLVVEQAQASDSGRGYTIPQPQTSRMGEPLSTSSKQRSLRVRVSPSLADALEMVPEKASEKEQILGA